MRFSSAANYSDSTQTGVPHSSFAFFAKEGGAFDFVSAGPKVNVPPCRKERDKDGAPVRVVSLGASKLWQRNLL